LSFFEPRKGHFFFALAQKSSKKLKTAQESSKKLKKLKKAHKV
jgi:hypothetical protein